MSSKTETATATARPPGGGGGGGGRGGGSSVVDVLDRVIGLGGVDAAAAGGGDGGAAPAPAAFVPSDRFRGPRPGYAFRTSEEFGTGYHLEDDANGDANGDAAPAAGGRKRARFDPARDVTRVIPPRSSSASIEVGKRRRRQPTGDELLAEAEASLPERAPRTLDPTPRGVRSAAQSLARSVEKNRLARAQHGDDPEKFMAAELAVNDDVGRFKDAAADVVRCYGILAEGGGAAEGLVGLLEHENSDVAIAVVDVFVELLDPSLLTEEGGEEGEGGEESDGASSPAERARSLGLLANAFVDAGGLEALASNLGRYDEGVEEDAKGVEDALTLVESLLDLDRSGALDVAREGGNAGGEGPRSVAATILERTTFLSWLFRRIDRSDGEDGSSAAATAPVSPAVVKLHASEVLSALLQHEDHSSGRCGRRLAALPGYRSAFDEDADEKRAEAKGSDDDSREKKDAIDGMESLLLAVAAYRKSDPQVEVECEFLENAFDALAAALLREDNVDDFVRAEGVELMLRCVRQRVHAGGGALRVLNFATSGAGDAHRRACETLVDAGGLKLLFPPYMGRKSAIPRPAACSEGGSDLAKRGNGDQDGDGGEGATTTGKRARRAAHARKRWLADAERHASDVVYALTRRVDANSPRDARARLLAKFVEEDCEKCDRAIELCLTSDERARAAEYRYYRSDAAEEAERRGADVELAALDAKLRGGGDAFHRSCAVLAFACAGSRRCRGHVMDQLRLRGAGMGVIKAGLEEFASLLDEGAQKAQIEHYITEI